MAARVCTVPLATWGSSTTVSSANNSSGTCGSPAGQERALYDALAGRSIKAAAVDVWYRYPTDGTGCAPSELQFATLPGILMTLHSSGVTTDTFKGRVDDVAANIGRLQRGEPLRNLVPH